MTVYRFSIEGKVLQEIGISDVDPSMRPRVGDEVKISSRPETIWKITRSIPSGNPDNQPVTYIVEDMRDINLIREGGAGDFNQAFVTNSKFGNEMYRFARQNNF